MERLTNKREADQQRRNYEKRLEQGYPRNIPEERFLRLAAYEDTGLAPEEIIRILKLIGSGDAGKIITLLDADSEGRLVVLPCRVGAKVYGHSGRDITEYTVAVISLATYNWYLRCQNHNSDFWITDAEIGKTVFLTREEAEEALEGGGADG